MSLYIYEQLLELAFVFLFTSAETEQSHPFLMEVLSQAKRS